MFILFMDRKGMILTLCSFPLHQILLTGNEVWQFKWIKTSRNEYNISLLKKRNCNFIYSRVYLISEQNFVNKNELQVWIFLDLINKHTHTRSTAVKVFDVSELRQAVMNIIFHMKTDQFVQIFDDWVRRHKKCVELLVKLVWAFDVARILSTVTIKYEGCP
jgi:hypothetical protein